MNFSANPLLTPGTDPSSAIWMLITWLPMTDDCRATGKLSAPNASAVAGMSIALSKAESEISSGRFVPTMVVSTRRKL